MTNRPVTVIILCWNRWDLTKKCLETIKEYTDLTNVKILVANNGSTDKTKQQLEKLDWISVLNIDKNLGFVRGNNAAIDTVDKESDIILLNNDTEIIQENWVKELQKTAYSSTDTGIVGCRLLTKDKKLLHAGTYILPDTYWGQQIGSLQEDVNQYNSDREVQGIVFACAYIKREVINKIGGLCLDYESYFEDTDYCLSAKEAGYKTMVCGKVTLIHNEHGSTESNPSSFSTLFNASKEKFIAKWSKKLSDQYVQSVDWKSILNFPSGYAMSCREILKSLEDINVYARYSYVYGKGTIFPVEENPNCEDYKLNVISNRSKKGIVPKISVVYGQGDVFNRNNGQYKIGYTMLEVDGFPKAWVDQCNQMNEVWVPSEFNKEGMIRSGVNRPIHIMPLGINPDYFNPAIKSHRNPNGDYVFFSNFEWNERKNPTMLLSTFNNTFTSDEKVVLVCKVMNSTNPIDIKGEIEKLNLSKDGGRIQFIYNNDIPSYQLGSLYTSSDCYVTVSHGEGWNLPLMEAMACGLPSIATNWGSHLQFINDRICYPLKVREITPATHSHKYFNGFNWANPDEYHFSYLLRYIYEHQGEAKQKGIEAYKEIHNNWTWKHAANRILNRLNEISKTI